MMLKRLFDFRDTGDDAKPLLQHIEELRFMLIKCAVVVTSTTTLSFFFRTDLARLIQLPLIAVDPERAANLQSLGVADSFTISLQLSLYAGLILAFPLVLLFLAEFILPALTGAEKRILYPVAGVGFGLFLVGAAFCYFVVLPQTLQFFFNDAKSMNWQPTWTVREYYSFATQFILGFGLAFELPLAVLVLVKLGIVNYQILKRTRAYAVVIIFFIAAIITPTTDIITLLLMGGPMYALYEICIVIAWFMGRGSHGE